MDSDSFAPSGQGQENNMTPQEPSEPNSIPESDSNMGSNIGTPDSESAHESNSESALESDNGPTDEPAFESAQESTRESVQESDNGSTQKSIQEQSQESAHGSAQEHPQDSTSVQAQGSTSSQSTTSAQQSAAIDATTNDSINKLASSPVRSPKRKNKLPIIIISCLIFIALIVALLFLIPLGNGKTIWQSIGDGTNSLQTGDEVETGGYTYYANLDLQYEPEDYFYEGLAKGYDSDYNAVFLNNAGELAFTVKPSYNIPYGYHFGDGLIVARCNNEDNETDSTADYDNPYGYIDKSGELVIPCSFASASNFKNGYAVVSRILFTGELVDPSTYSEIRDEKGYIVETEPMSIEQTTQQYGIIDTSGKFVVDYQDDMIISDASTFKDGIYMAHERNSDTSYCYNLKGENLGEYNIENNNCQIETSKQDTEAKKAIKQELPDGYSLSDFSEGVALVSSANRDTMYFVDTDGNTLWTVDTTNLIDIDDSYHGGLVYATIWVGQESFPGADAINNNENPTEDFQGNVVRVLYDRQGRIVFKYKLRNMSNDSPDESQ